MYVAAKGGARAIAAAHRWHASARRGDIDMPALSIAQIRAQLSLSVARVMAEGSLYDPDLAALAIKQARGDLIEAVFLIRAYRTTLPRFGASTPIETGAMACIRRISATFKDVPGGQILGPTFDYSHRLIDFALAAEAAADATEPPAEFDAGLDAMPRVSGYLDREGLIEPARTGRQEDEDATPDIARDQSAGSAARRHQTAPRESAPPDLTREPLELPASRALRLQALARGDEGFLLGLAYSTQRGYARTHPFVSELRIGMVTVELEIPELGFSIEIGEIEVTECETVNQFTGSAAQPAQFTRGYGLAFGQSERKAIAMALVDRALRWEELGEDDVGAPAQDTEFVLYHADNIQATGFLEHIKLPHYVDFQAELELVRRLRAEAEAAPAEAAE